MVRPFILLLCSLGALPTAAAQPCRRVVPVEMMEWPHVELVSQGAPPLRELRVELKAGDVERRLLDLDVAMARVGEEGVIPAAPVPLLVFEIETRIDSVDSSGLASVSFRYLNADIRPMPGVPISVLRTVRERVQGLEGTGGEYLLTPCLYADSISMTGVEDMDPLLASQMEDLQASIGLLSDPFPDEAVGVGAQWTVKWERVESAASHARTGGIRYDIETLYTVESIDGDRVEIRSELRQKADMQQIAPPELSGQTVVLLSLTSEGAGTQRWDLSASLPLESSSQLLTEQVLMVEQELEDVIETQQIEVRSSLREAPDR